MRFMIFTQPDDAHAVMVQLALIESGHQVRLFFTADQPSLLSHSIWMDASQTGWRSSYIKTLLKLNAYDVIWYRRVHLPMIKEGDSHPDDYRFVARENRLFFEGLTTWLSHQAWWVNPALAARQANSKLLQLFLARSCGLKIPKTLCSNTPQDIHTFISSCSDQSVIYKPLCSHAWFESGSLKAAYTSMITVEQLPPDEILKLTPGLFQVHIEKRYELRVTCFGKHCVAVKVDSQKHPMGKVDWRAIPEQALSLSLYQLPAKIQFKLQILMQKLGLVFACIDMIVTHQGEYVFLEVNEQGQFLWIDEYCPDAHLLDRFIQFITHRSFEFEWQKSAQPHTLSQYREATESIVQMQLKHHVDTRLMREY